MGGERARAEVQAPVAGQSSPVPGFSREADIYKMKLTIAVDIQESSMVNRSLE